jgi:AraC-like DNA-binding protein
MTEYIQTHLHENITAKDVSNAAGYSQYHAARVFKEKMGMSPFEYIRRERLLQSAYLLRNYKVKILDVAIDYVFDSHSGFTRAFTKAFGINPKKYALYPEPQGWNIPYRYLDRSKLNLEESDMSNSTVIFTQIIERPARKLILKRSRKATHYFEYCEEVGCGENYNSEPWDILCGIKEHCMSLWVCGCRTI